MNPILKPNAMRPTDWMLLLLLSTFWGGAYIFGKVAVQELRIIYYNECRRTVPALGT